MQPPVTVTTHTREEVQEPSPFHPGEHEVQARIGVRDIETWARKVVRSHLPESHRDFYASLPFLVVAARDTVGRPWVTLLVGEDGFVSAPDGKKLVIDAAPARGDALDGALVPGRDIGILGIELSSRRRNRVNGRIVTSDGGVISVEVEQSFGNCPQYIRERELRRTGEPTAASAERTKALSVRQREWIANSDTFFIGTGYRGDGESESFGMDASHRGGERGFVEVLDASRIRFPDYAGNNHFNSIGNLVLDPRIGVTFIDFENGGILQLSGAAAIDWEPGEATRSDGAQRLVEIRIDQVVEIRNALPLRWESDAALMRSLRLIEKTPESSDVTSFVFEARDGGALPAFEPGQHLPIELVVDGVTQPVRRTYSLSSAPAGPSYRISVKRQPHGLVSRHLHDHLEPGAIIEARAPAGEFVMTCNQCPIVLLSAGVGVTPMMSMLETIAMQPAGRRVWFVHGARDGLHHPFAADVRAIAAANSNIDVHVAYSRPRDDDVLGEHYDSVGRVDGELLAGLISGVDAHYFLCGPVQFMAEIQAALERLAVPVEQIHHESFGPVA